MTRLLLIVGCLASLLISCGGSQRGRYEPTAPGTPAGTGTPFTLDLGGRSEAEPPPEPRALDAQPPSPFPDWDGVSTMVYDMGTLTSLNLGEGSGGSFSPDSKHMAWVSGPPNDPSTQNIWVIDLPSRIRRRLAPGRYVSFLDDTTVSVVQDGGHRVALDIETGKEVTERSPSPRPTGAAETLPRYEVTEVAPLTPATLGVREFVVRDVQADRDIFRLTAALTTLADRSDLLVVTPPENGSSRIYVIEVPSGVAHFVSTVHYSQRSWPIGADARFVVWTPDYCEQTPGRTRIFDRQSGKLYELDQSFWVSLTRNSLIGIGAFGPVALLDPKDLSYVAVLPRQSKSGPSRSAGDPSWSPDYSYASRGFVGGHGGVCL
jgi:hypothetical protein